MKKLSLILALALCATSLFSCSKDNSSTDSPAEGTTPVSGTTTTASVTATSAVSTKKTEISTDVPLTVNYKELYLAIGATEQATFLAIPSCAQNKSLIWKSNAENIATVTSDGKITGKSMGLCTVTVTSEYSKSINATVVVIVTTSGAGSTITNPPVTAATTEPPPVTDENGSVIETPPQTEAVTTTAATPAPTTGDIEGATYINGILVVNKSYPLPATYNPGGLSAETDAAVKAMQGAAWAEGISLWVQSGFRSYETQQTLYNNYVKRDGVTAADTYSARPGHSEHQSGFAFDVNIASSKFIGTPAQIWIDAHCTEYGFIIRYPKGKESITGYAYEPWHLRYVGVDLAKDIAASGKCLEEYLGVTSVYAQ